MKSMPLSSLNKTVQKKYVEFCVKVPCGNRAMSKSSDEETDEPLIADHRNFYKVEKWTKDGSKVDHMLYAGSSLDKAAGGFCGGDLPSAADPADHPAADAGARAVAEPGFVGKVADRCSRVGDLTCGLDGDLRDRPRGYVGFAMRRQSDVHGPSLSGGFSPAR